MWAWSRDECTAWNGRLGRRVQPGSRGTRAGRRLGGAGSPCTLQERDGETKTVSVLLNKREGGTGSRAFEQLLLPTFKMK